MPQRRWLISKSIDACTRDAHAQGMHMHKGCTTQFPSRISEFCSMDDSDSIPIKTEMVWRILSGTRQASNGFSEEKHRSSTKRRRMNSSKEALRTTHDDHVDVEMEHDVFVK